MTTLWLYLDPTVHPTEGGSNNERTFGNIATNRGMQQTYGVRPENSRMFSNGQQILDIISEYDQITRLAIFAHGAPRGIGTFWRPGQGIGIFTNERAGGKRNLAQFAQVLGPKLAPDTLISLCACSCGRGPREGSGSGAEAIHISRYNFTGHNSFAYQMRNVLSRYTTVEVRAHLTSGGAIDNPYCIFFRSPEDSPGVNLLRDVAEHPGNNDRQKINQSFSWSRYFRGERAREWLLGGPLPEDLELKEGLDRELSNIPGLIPITGNRENAVDQPLNSNPVEVNDSAIASNPYTSESPILGSPPASNLGEREELVDSMRLWARLQRENLSNSVWRRN